MELVKKLGCLGTKASYGEFKCDYCGLIVTKRVDVGRLAKSCGCMSNILKTKHGDNFTKSEYHKLYRLWQNIKDRCCNGKSKDYKYYGARGIRFYPAWKRDYFRFRKDMIDLNWKIGLEIDRIDDNKSYTPNNVRFVTREINGQNRRTVKLNPQKVEEIRDKFNSGLYTRKQLANEYGAIVRYMGSILLERVWKNI
jgi:hypothetical protein